MERLEDEEEVCAPAVLNDAGVARAPEAREEHLRELELEAVLQCVEARRRELIRVVRVRGRRRELALLAGVGGRAHHGENAKDTELGFRLGLRALIWISRFVLDRSASSPKFRTGPLRRLRERSEI